MTPGPHFPAMTFGEGATIVTPRPSQRTKKMSQPVDNTYQPQKPTQRDAPPHIQQTTVPQFFSQTSTPSTEPAASQNSSAPMPRILVPNTPENNGGSPSPFVSKNQMWSKTANNRAY
ncbi:hypothetical protein OF83DRAFT_1178517 [Amylostereum chailletii]|nr:hypothetical protein OF83DRAFT_1178517 [Amylostereum chailletii]